MTKWFIDNGAAAVNPIDITFENFDTELMKHPRVHPLNMHLGDHAESPLLHYDIVWCHHCLEHVPDCIGFLNAVADALKDGGWLWIAVPNMAPYEVFSPGHIHNFMAPQLLEQLKMAGFDIFNARVWAKNSQLRVRVQRRANGKYPAPMQEELERTGRCQASTLNYHNWKAVDRP